MVSVRAPRSLGSFTQGLVQASTILAKPRREVQVQRLDVAGDVRPTSSSVGRVGTVSGTLPKHCIGQASCAYAARPGATQGHAVAGGAASHAGLSRVVVQGDGGASRLPLRVIPKACMAEGRLVRGQRRRSVGARAQFSSAPWLACHVRRPPVLAGQDDVLPGHWRKMPEQLHARPSTCTRDASRAAAQTNSSRAAPRRKLRWVARLTVVRSAARYT